MSRHGGREVEAGAECVRQVVTLNARIDVDWKNGFPGWNAAGFSPGKGLKSCPTAAWFSGRRILDIRIPRPV